MAVFYGVPFDAVAHAKGDFEATKGYPLQDDRAGIRQAGPAHVSAVPESYSSRRVARLPMAR